MAQRAYVEAPNAQIHIDEIRDDVRHWVAGEIARDARRFAARDTGYMADHIVISDDATRIDVLGAGLPPNAEAPAYVEFGTRGHWIPNAFGYGITVWHPGTAPQPFLRPAAYRKRSVPPWVVQQRSSQADR